MITTEEMIKALQKGLPMGYDLRDEIASIVEKADIYKWHDLRKNPDDLPKPMSMNILVLANWNEYCRHEYGILAVGLDGRWCDGLSYLDDVDVIAWKYIEPVEVGE